VTAAAATTPGAAPTLVAHVAPAPDDAGLSLPVRFAFGSAEILPSARSQLDAVATGIKLLPAEAVITIEGHTDAVGGDAYNLALSRERARSVRDYLVLRHGIDVTHLKTAGYGEGRPIVGSDPFDGANRRVEFRGS
jgi:outer membrane protein OmpA-like peptidoglycan-associated protein